MAPLIHNLVTTVQSLYSWSWTPGNRWIRIWVGPRAGLDVLVMKKITCPTENRIQRHPVRSLVTVPTEPHEIARNDTLIDVSTDRQCGVVDMSVHEMSKCVYWRLWDSAEQVEAVRRTAQWTAIVNRMMKHEIRLAEHAARMVKNRYAYRFSVQKSEGRRPLGRPRHRT